MAVQFTNSMITGTGSYLPEQVLTNDDIAQRVETDDEWIRSRTGISSRHLAGDHESNVYMSTQAAQRALDAAGISPEEIDLILVATVSPTYTFPATACFIQSALGVPAGAAAMDLQGACSGFIYGLQMADAQIKTGHCKKALVLGAEKFSAYIDWTDRSTCVLFGDGAGAVVLEAREGDAREGLLASSIHADGNNSDLLIGTGGLSSTGTIGHVNMKGREVYRHAVRRMVEAVGPLLEQEKISTDQVDWLIPHQANLRIIEAAAAQLDFPLEKVIQTVAHHANTSAASIPLALDDANKRGLFKPGQTIVLTAFGAGFTWGGAVLRWC
mgnify:CR=1 FL=1